jgi:hypothetical protein
LLLEIDKENFHQIKKLDASKITMPKTLSILKSPNASKIIFWLSVFLFLYFLIMLQIGGLRSEYHVIQLIIELFFLPTLIMLVVLPAASIYLLFKNKFRLLSLPFYSMLILAAVILLFLLY